MAVTSLPYMVFVAVVFALFRILPERLRPGLFLSASLFFYMTYVSPASLSFLAVASLASYLACRAVERGESDRARKSAMIAGVATCILGMALSRMLPFLYPGTHSGSSAFATTVGVSFFSLQAIASIVDVYLGTGRHEPDPVAHAAALAFFPKLLQGPIAGSGAILVPMKRPFVFDYEAARSALLLFAWGFFKKRVLADHLSVHVDAVYGDVRSFSGLALVIGTYLYAFELYFDFSGYTDMARAVARLFGIELPVNFRRPYAASSIPEFWRRWHMSFSRWILDYIFRPLQMSWRRGGTWGSAAALLLTFILSGIWHGASAGFVVWGLLHGIYMAASLWLRPASRSVSGSKDRNGRGRTGSGSGAAVFRDRARRWAGCAITFNLVCFSWIFFRAESMDDALYIVAHLFDTGGAIPGPAYLLETVRSMGIGARNLAIGCALVAAAGTIEAKGRGGALSAFVAGLAAPVRWPFYAAILYVLTFLAAQGTSAFLYLRF